MTVVSVRNVVRIYRRGGDEVRALDGVTLDIEAGQVVALLGPSGSGKSSLLHLLGGWEQPDAGTVVRSGDALTGTWTGTAVVPQSLGLLDELTIGENVALPLRVGRRGSRSRPDADGNAGVGVLLTSLGIGHLGDRLPVEVSMGEQQRAAIARALVAMPRLLLADEPTSHLDHSLVGTVFGELRGAAMAGTAVVIATHDPAGVEQADLVVRMRDGRIEAIEEANPAMTARWRQR